MPSIGATTLPGTGEGWAAGELGVEDYQRLSWFKATCVARAHLERAGLAPEPGAARHLAFGLWLRASGRLDGEFRPATPG
jgi:hypothetical protein